MLDKRVKIFIKLMLLIVLAATGSAAIIFRENLAPLKTLKLTQSNPTSYEFLAPPNIVVQTIIDAFSNAKPVSSSFYRELPLQSTAPISMNVTYTAETRKNALFGKDIFRRPGNKTDVYLHSFGEPILSSVYCSLGHRLPYRVEFSIRVQALEYGSRVIVEALNPRVLKGIGGLGPHGPYSAELPVKSTTIEEYSLLRYIGNVLGSPPMPPVIIPGEQCT